MRLNVGMLGAENLLRALDGKALDAVHIFAAAVIALARIAFRIFIREDRAHRFHHGAGNEILRRDQFEAGGLAANFVLQRRSDLRVGLIEMQAHAFRFGCLVISFCHFEPFIAGTL